LEDFFYCAAYLCRH